MCIALPNFVSIGQNLYVSFCFCKTVAVRSVGFFKIRNFNCQSGSECQRASQCQISCRSVSHLLSYGRFSIFQDGGCLPSWVFKSTNFSVPRGFGVPVCVTTPNSCRSVKPLQIYNHLSIFQDRGSPPFKMAAVSHLGFLKVRNFNCQSGSEGQHASQCQISCRSVNPLLSYGRFSIFHNGGRPPS